MESTVGGAFRRCSSKASFRILDVSLASSSDLPEEVGRYVESRQNGNLVERLRHYAIWGDLFVVDFGWQSKSRRVFQS
jgi:hypothetical protein